MSSETAKEGATKRAANLTTLMLTQDYNPNHWMWSDNEKKALGSAKATGQVILDRLVTAGITVKEAYAISHDKDEKEMWKYYESSYRKDFVANHIHFVCKMEEGATLGRLADIIGMSPQYIEKPKSGKYAYDNMLAYLTHIKYAEKYQYSPADVITLCGTDYEDYYAKRYESWKKARANKIQKEARISLKELEIQIIDGIVTEQDLLDNPKYKYVYHLNFQRIDRLLRNKYQIQLKKIGKEQEQQRQNSK